MTAEARLMHALAIPKLRPLLANIESDGGPWHGSGIRWVTHDATLRSFELATMRLSSLSAPKSSLTCFSAYLKFSREALKDPTETVNQAASARQRRTVLNGVDGVKSLARTLELLAGLTVRVRVSPTSPMSPKTTCSLGKASVIDVAQNDELRPEVVKGLEDIRRVWEGGPPNLAAASGKQ